MRALLTVALGLTLLHAGCGRAGSLPPPSPETSNLLLTMAGGTACAARIGGGVQCWNTADGLTAPETATGLVDVRQLATNDAWVGALGGDGSVSCWGHDGRTGFGPTPVPRVNNVIGINVGTFVDSHACAILGDGTVQCWDFPNPVPGPLAGITGAVEFSSGTGD